MASSSSLSGEVWVHIQLDRAASNAKKNKTIPIETPSECRARSNRSRNRHVRFEDGWASSYDTAPTVLSQAHPARSPQYLRLKSKQILAHTERYRNSCRSNSRNQPVMESGKNDDIAKDVLPEWSSLCQAITHHPDQVLANFAGNMMQSFGQLLEFKQ
jgi:hypothetical protein